MCHLTRVRQLPRSRGYQHRARTRRRQPHVQPIQLEHRAAPHARGVRRAALARRPSSCPAGAQVGREPLEPLRRLSVVARCTSASAAQRGSAHRVGVAEAGRAAAHARQPGAPPRQLAHVVQVPLPSPRAIQERRRLQLRVLRCLQTRLLPHAVAQPT
eukprot:scaffold9339_cov64-Phaeocystis_antarctica.AAC.1